MSCVKALNPLKSDSQEQYNRFQFELFSILSMPCYQKSIINELIVQRYPIQWTINIEKSSIGKSKGNKLRFIKLRFLICDKYQSIFLTIFKRIIRCLKFLSIIKVAGSNRGDQWLRIISKSHFSFLAQLTMKSNKITEEGIRNMQDSTWKYLRQLDFSNNPIKNKGLCELTKIQFPNLHYLDLRFCNLTQFCVNSFFKGAIPELKYLDLTGNRMGNKLQEKVIFHNYLKKLRTLKMLDYSYVENAIRVSRPIFHSREQSSGQLKISIDSQNIHHYAYIAELIRNSQFHDFQNHHY